MLNGFLRDPLNYTLTFTAIGVTILIFLLQRRRKRLSCEIVSKDDQLVVVRIINSGNVSIEPDDYNIPIRVELGENSQILTAEVFDTEPKILRQNVNIKTENTKVVLNPIHLNEENSITLKIQVRQFDPQKQISVKGHIDSVTHIQEAKEGIAKRNGFHICEICLKMIGIFGLCQTPSWHWMVVFFMGYILVLLGCFLYPPPQPNHLQKNYS